MGKSVKTIRHTLGLTICPICGVEGTLKEERNIKKNGKIYGPYYRIEHMIVHYAKMPRVMERVVH